MNHTGKTKLPSGVVQWPDADEIMQMAFEEGQPGDDASGYYFELEEFDLFLQRLMEEVARLNSSPVSAGEPVYQFQCREIGEGDWEPCDHSRYMYCQKSPEMDTRVVQVQALSAPNHSERVPELSSFVAFADALGLDLRQSDDQWNSALALYEKFIAAYPQPSAALSAPSHGEQVRHMVPAWNLAADELPASGKTVLAFYLNSHGMGRRIRAMHVKRFTVEAEEFADPDTQCCEYSEQDDCYYTTEGWYELIDNWPDYSSCAVIEGVVTHWMPLPAAPSAGSQKEQG